MSERDDEQRRELLAAGWEPRGRGRKAIWRSPVNGYWYARHQALLLLRKEGHGVEEQSKARRPRRERTGEA